MHFLFGLHGAAEDFEPALQLLEESDVIAPEMPDWTPESLEWFRSVSHSNTHSFRKLLQHQVARAYTFNPYSEALVNGLQGSDKSVIFVDMPHGTPIKSPYSIPNQARTLDDALTELYEVYTTIVQGGAQRDQIIAKNLGPAASQAITEHPFLQDKDNVSALVLLGSYHDKIYSHLDNSPHTKNQVTASYATAGRGSTADHYRSQLIEDIRSNTPLSRRVLLGIFVANRLDQILDKEMTNPYGNAANRLDAESQSCEQLLRGVDDDLIEKMAIEALFGNYNHRVGMF